MAMDKKIKRKWLKALRSGEFTRGTGALCTATKRGDRFCCLGVLAFVQGGLWEQYDDCVNLYPILPDGNTQVSSGYLDYQLAGGLQRSEQNELADMNDGGASFRKIADYIDRNL